MKIDGKAIASEILENLKLLTRSSKPANPPTLAVILIGNNPPSISYVKQKQKTANQIGAELILKEFPDTISQNELMSQISILNSDLLVHGIIVQRPLPVHINQEEIANAVSPEKDIDGFHPDSKFTPPLALAVLKILEFIYSNITRNPQPATKQLINWLKTKQILILGRGETGGKPVAETFKKLNIPFKQAHSRTANTLELIKNADIIISAVGKPNFINGSMIKKGAICIGIGISRIPASSFQLPASPESGKKDILVGDLEENSVSLLSSFYTPTPGGIGPVNVACLFDNLINK